ncbi:MAG: 50S ribosomal protein L11 methyltransferase [Actinobacteria bacterium]|nr:50S ribosomal protein L11 methyltransferase [Actinomycetota bacterium]
MTHRYTVRPGDADREVLLAALWTAGAVGVWERDDELAAWFPEPVPDVPGGGRWEAEPDHDWSQVWKAGLEPVEVGRLVVAPSWTDPRPSDAILIDPGMAFGTGHHATTRLCLAALQQLDLSGARVLDVGTGTGVLAIAAARLGAAHVVAVDTDPDAVAAARANAACNRVDVDVRWGTVEAATPGPFDVVVANLLTDVVIGLAGDLLAAAAPGGTLVVSGISVERANEVAACLAALGAGVAAVATEGGWVAIGTGRPPGDPY